MKICNCFNKTIRNGVNFSLLAEEDGDSDVVLDMTWVKFPIFITKEQRENLCIATKADLKLIKGNRK